jgi:hypothetical protein
LGVLKDTQRKGNQVDHKQSTQAFARALRVLVEKAKLDNGKSYDDLAEKIRQRSADGLIEEAIGYLPEELEMPPECGCSIRPLQFDREGNLLGPHPGGENFKFQK